MYSVMIQLGFMQNPLKDKIFSCTSPLVKEKKGCKKGVWGEGEGNVLPHEPNFVLELVEGGKKSLLTS